MVLGNIFSEKMSGHKINWRHLFEDYQSRGYGFDPPASLVFWTRLQTKVNLYNLCISGRLNLTSITIFRRTLAHLETVNQLCFKKIMIIG